MTTENELPLGLYWKGKRTTVDRTVLPFQNLEVIETINESRATRERERTGAGPIINFEASAVGDANWIKSLYVLIISSRLKSMRRFIKAEHDTRRENSKTY